MRRLHSGDDGPVPARAAGFRPDPGRGRAASEPARVLETHPALPLYTESDALNALTQLQPIGYHRPIEIVPGITIEFAPAGHLLGSAFVVARLQVGPTILFGGDLGATARPVLPDPSDAVAADVVLVESTYGDRDHVADDNGEQLAQVIRDTVERGGKLIIPAFAIGRVEEVLYWMRRLEQERRDPGAAGVRRQPDGERGARSSTPRARRSSTPTCVRPRRSVSTFATTRFQTIASPQQSKELTASRKAGDRDLLERHGDRRARAASPGGGAAGRANTVLFVGYQADGTRGRQLVDGAREVRIHGQAIPVQRAHREDRLDVGARRSRRDPALARHASRRRRGGSVWCTASRARWTRSRRSCSSGSGGTPHTPQHLERFHL